MPREISADSSKSPELTFLVEIVSTAEVGDIAQEMGHQSHELQEDWRRRAEAGSLVMFVVRDGAKSIASVNLLTAGPDEQAVRDEIGAVPTVIALDVKAAYRQRHIGSDLMEACETYVRTHPDLPQQIALGAVAPNTPARTMYENRGYLYQAVDGRDFFETSWPEVDSAGNQTVRTAECLLMVKDLHEPTDIQ